MIAPPRIRPTPGQSPLVADAVWENHVPIGPGHDIDRMAVDSHRRDSMIDPDE